MFVKSPVAASDTQTLVASENTLKLFMGRNFMLTKSKNIQAHWIEGTSELNSGCELVREFHFFK